MTARTVAVTGSSGLIGTALSEALGASGYGVRGLDLRAGGPERGDILNADALERLLDGCVGVIHLAAVSRVIDGERDPERCWRTNVEGTRNVLRVARKGPRPWLIYASSREVYGQPLELPADEDTPRRPVNVYGRSKVAAEDLVHEADLSSLVVRFSNVYGWVGDHRDRVVPAFARQAVDGAPLRVDGSGHTFDFTHVDDVVRGLMLAIARLDGGDELPDLHLVSGVATRLGDLARLAVELAGGGSPIREAEPRSYDVGRFCGDPTRASEVLGWRATTPLTAGLIRFLDDIRAERATEEK